MGSATESFVLGFLPVQIKRRTDGGGGYYEPTGPDEATQLQRFIDYGLITGMSSPDDVLPLEQMEGSRTPRNEHELIAQAYLLGNCAHCHNPRGEPSFDSPVLTCLLNFLPGPEGGIFQFPLERYSPRIFRGRTGTTQIPYITPSLVDHPRYDPNNLENVIPSPFASGTLGSVGGVSNNAPVGNVVYAPWRSLLYRNVDNGFAYIDDEALFPHMPPNTGGYDPRLKQILADWMVSIPSALKNPQLAEYEVVTSENQTLFATCARSPCPIDASEQPYVEVLPGQPGYPSAVQAAATRLQILHTGYNAVLPPATTTFSRYADPLDTTDVLDPDSLRDPICHPVPVASAAPEGQVLPPPQHPHWAVTDLTSPPGNYTPRRPDWASVLVPVKTADGGVTNPTDTASTAQGCGDSVASQLAAAADEAFAIDLVQTVRIGLDPESSADPCSGTTSGDTAFACWAKTPIPFGLWKDKPGCTFPPSVHPASYYAGAARPRWMNDVANLSPDAPVYEETPGASVYKMICINCHGSLADSSGRLADNLATMTGGNARVADFRDGFMGPAGSALAASDRQLIFGDQALPQGASADWTSASTDDRAARYFSWMALGGTKAIIPPEILQIVSLTQVLGEQRPYLNAGQLSANMLSTAKAICLTFFGSDSAASFDLGQGVYGFIDENKSLIHDNGDAETWFELCTRNHPSPVHALQGSVAMNGSLSLSVPVANDGTGFAVVTPMLIDPDSYLAHGSLVGNVAGGVDPKLTADNLWPWCIAPYLGTTTETTTAVVQYAMNHGLPICPTPGPNVTTWSTADAQRWAGRGAINAGLSVFLYLRSLEDKTDPDPDYNQCELLSGSTGASTGTCGGN
jgi:mono/diheme cytochrome c family protein